MERRKIISNTKEHVAPVEKLIIPIPEPRALVDEPKPIQWRKIGGGSFRLASGRIIKSNEVFEAYEHEVPTAFRKSIVPLDPKTFISEKEKPLTVNKAIYKIEAAGDGFFNVANAGKVLNEKPLSLEEAEDLVEALQK